MAGYTKADYDLNYDIGAEGEWGHPNTREGVRLHYVRAIQEQFFMPRWDAIVPHLGLLATHRVVIAGSGFGWSVDYLKVLVPGINAIGVDISDYVDGEKGVDEAADIDAAITAVGLDPLVDRGLQIHNKYVRPGPRSKSIVLKEDMESTRSRAAVVAELGRPTHIITENMIQEFTDVEILQWRDQIDNFTTTDVIHVVSGTSRLRSPQDIATRTGHRVLLVGAGFIQDDVR